MHRIRIVLPSPLKQWYNGNKGGQVKAKATKRAIATATRVASNNDGNVCGGKGNGNGEEGGGWVRTRALAASTTVAGDVEGDGDGNEGGEQQRGWKW